MGKQSRNFATFVFLALFVVLVGTIFQFGLNNTSTIIDKDIQTQKHSDQLDTQAKPATSVPAASKAIYLPETQSKVLYGLEFTASNFIVDADQVYVDVCYDLPGKAVWDINQAALEYGSSSTSDFSVQETSIDLAEGKPNNGIRCLKLNFAVTPGADVSQLTLKIKNIGQVPPAEGKECDEFLSRINANDRVKNAGVEVACEQLEMGSNIKVVSKPAELSEDEANQLINHAMHNLYDGDWVFTVTRK